MPRQEGSFLVEDFFENTGGLNTADSPFLVGTNQATGGQNYDYIRRGGFQKRAGHTKLNSVADTQPKTLGLGLFDKPGSARAVIRSAGQKIQYFDSNAVSFTSLTQDTAAASSSFWASGSVVPVVSSMFNTPSSGVLWMSGAGATALYGAYSSTKATKNGVDTITGTASATNGGTGGSWASTGTIRYAFALYKAATGATGNVAAECPATIAAVTDTITLNLASLGTIDTTKYTKLYIYRSGLGGAVGFTTGDLVKTLDISTGVPATTTDTGPYLATAVNVPRPGNIILDNSPLAADDYRTVTTFKRRLVTAARSTVYLSDLNKPESWPLTNSITIPSGGDITGLAVISLSTPYSNGSDELLCVFKQREVWVITGSDYTDWSLKFVDNSGCSNQSLVVAANGFIAWIGYRGVYLWDGSGKPAYMSQSIEDKFQRTGEIDKSSLLQGFGLFIQSRNEVQWYLTSSTAGTQRFCLKLDLRLTLSNAAGKQVSLADRQLQGVFTPDKTGFSVYAGLSFLESSTASDELVYLGDDSGFLYSAYTSTSEAGGGYTMEYISPFLNFGSPSLAKRVHKIVLWVLDTGAFNIELDFWSNYRYADSDASAQSHRVSANLEGISLTWDVGKWDANYWDSSSLKVKPLVYNLSSVKNNTEGDSFRFRITQTGSAQQVVVYGYSVYYTEISLRK